MTIFKKSLKRSKIVNEENLLLSLLQKIVSVLPIAISCYSVDFYLPLFMLQIKHTIFLGIIGPILEKQFE